MSEPENFLSRWARLKREAAETPDDAAPDAPAKDVRAETPAEETAPPAPELEFDISALPPIESITASTDIRAFLAPGVPPELKRAALRRAWVADPTIRDFVGIAENQWDFNDPDAIPGFGSLGPLDDVARLLAQVIGEPRNEDGAPAVRSEEKSLPEETPGTPELPETATTLGEATVPHGAHEPSTPAPEVHRSNPDAAAHVARMEDEAAARSEASTRRMHGGALPKES